MNPTAAAPVVRAPRGSELSCQGWVQEAALRMLMNNLDPEVAERPEDLVVYGGTGRAARDWESFRRIVSALRSLANDETLLIQSGKPVGVFRTHPDSPRVLLANSNLVPRWGTWEHFWELEKKGLMDTLRNQIVERKVIELIEKHAEFRDVPYKPQQEEVVAVNYAAAGAGAEAIPSAEHNEGINPATVGKTKD